jgi:DNA repair exonuclease SbcCD ATPase subunit
MTSKPTDKNTKAEILTAYNQLLEEKKTVDIQVRNLQKQPAHNPVKEEPKPTMKAPVIEDKVSHSINSLSSLYLGFGSAVSELSEKLTTEAATLAEVRDNVASEIASLQELHQVEVGENTFEELIETYQTSAKNFDRELTQNQEAYQQEVDTQTKAWQKEQEQHQVSIKERTELDRKNRQRESQEYKYNLELKRQIDREQHEQQQQSLYQELAETKETQEKVWQERETALADREKLFHEVKDKVAAFAQEKETAIDKAKEEGKGIAFYQAKIKSDLYAKDVEGQKHFYEGRIESLEHTIGNQQERINSLSKQLEAALKQVQDLAVKAIEGSANANSYQTLKEITLEQAKSQSKAK